MRTPIYLSVLIFFFIFTSCESETAKNARLVREEQERIEQEVYDWYIDNSLITGATPYYQWYGGNTSCYGNDCSEIKVTTSNSDVLVIIKNNNNVVRHAYIQANNSFTFSISNGYYQTFFYYGKGWNPNKEMKNGQLKGGFVSNEDFGKDDPQYLENNILEYELILQQNGNFSTRPSNENDAL